MKSQAGKSRHGKITSSYFRRSVDEDDCEQKSQDELAKNSVQEQTTEEQRKKTVSRKISVSLDEIGSGDGQKKEDNAETKVNRRMTLPVINVRSASIGLENDDEEEEEEKSTGHFDCRRSSLTNVAIGCSITPSLAGIFPQVPDLVEFKRSATESNLLMKGETLEKRRGSRWAASKLPFLNIQIPEDKQVDWSASRNTSSSPLDNRLFPQAYHQHYYALPHIPHIHVPSFNFANSDGFGRKFSFGIRRHSHAVSQQRCIQFVCSAHFVTR